MEQQMSFIGDGIKYKATLIEEQDKENIQINYIKDRFEKKQNNRPPLKNHYINKTIDTYNSQEYCKPQSQKTTIIHQQLQREKQRRPTFTENIERGQANKNKTIDQNQSVENINILKRDYSQQQIHTSRAQYNLQRELSYDNNLQNLKTVQNKQKTQNLQQNASSMYQQLHINSTSLQIDASLSSHDITQQPSITQRSHSISSRFTDHQLPPKSIKMPSSGLIDKQRNSSKIRLNIKHFVKEIIKTQMFELTYKDKSFSHHLKRFVNESNEFLANSEKHYRMKFMMDLVTALVSTIHEYITDHTKQDRVALERQALKKEQDKFNSKYKKFKKCEQDLKTRIIEFEEVFNIFSELKTTYDQDKQDFIKGYLNKQNVAQTNLNLERQEMQLEDDRSRILKEQEKVTQKENFLNQELIKLKGDQNKLQDDIQEFISIKEQFETQRKQKGEQLNQMKQAIHDKFSQMDIELKHKDTNLRKLEQDLRLREKSITDLILNNQDTCQNDMLLRSYNKTINFAEDTCKNFDFEHFLGQFESHKDELMEREKAISKFLNKNDPKRSSTTSIYTLDSLRESMQKTTQHQQIQQ